VKRGKIIGKEEEPMAQSAAVLLADAMKDGMRMLILME
jgi:hypothetical protein